MWQDISQNLRSMLRALGDALSFAPPAAVAVVLLIIAVAVAWLIHAAILALLRPLLNRQRPYLKSILDATKNPTRAALLLIALAIALPIAPLGSDTAGVLARILLLATICLFGWIALAGLNIAAKLYLRNVRIDVED